MPTADTETACMRIRAPMPAGSTVSSKFLNVLSLSFCACAVAPIIAVFRAFLHSLDSHSNFAPLTDKTEDSTVLSGLRSSV